MVHITEFINDFRTQSKKGFFALYDKNEITQHCKTLGLDITTKDTKDELYRRLKSRLEMPNYGTPNMTILRENLRGG